MWVINTRGTALTRRVAALAVCFFLGGCRAAEKAQLPVNPQPFAFVDARSGAPLERVLIVPKYSSSTGVSSGAGHGPGYMTQSSFLAFPFIYQTGRHFAPTQPDSSGLLLGRPGDFFVGHGVIIQGVIVIAPVHRAVWVWQLWDRVPSAEVPLQPLSDSEARERNGRLRTLFEKSRIRGAELTGSELEIFSTIKDFDIDVRFNAAERQTVLDLLTK
jgi:hypothetical protein